MKYLPLFLASSFVFTASFLLGQDESKALVSFYENKVFVGVENHFRVVIQQEEPVRLDQLSAVLRAYGDEKEPEAIPLEISQTNYGFRLRSAESGLVEITVTLEDGVKERYDFYTKPLTAVPKLGGYSAKHVEPVRANVFKAQSGIYTEIQEIEINAKCEIISYELIRVTGSEDARVVLNTGGNYELEAKRLVMAAKPGDRYIFTKIRYRCPGALADQMGGTMSFELK